MTLTVAAVAAEVVAAAAAFRGEGCGRLSGTIVGEDVAATVGGADGTLADGNPAVRRSDPARKPCCNSTAPFRSNQTGG